MLFERERAGSSEWIQFIRVAVFLLVNGMLFDDRYSHSVLCLKGVAVNLEGYIFK